MQGKMPVITMLRNRHELVSGGETGIRTLGRLAPTTVFETAPFDHSGTSPQALSLVIPNPADKPIF